MLLWLTLAFLAGGAFEGIIAGPLRARRRSRAELRQHIEQRVEASVENLFREVLARRGIPHRRPPDRVAGGQP
jgi:hypothetical protein